MMFFKSEPDYFPIGTSVLYTFYEGKTVSKTKTNPYGEFIVSYKVIEQRVHKISGIAQDSYGHYLYKICDKWYRAVDVSKIIKQ